MANGPEPEVVTCGEAMLLMPAEPGIPLDRAVAFRRSVAGAEPNAAIGLARLGHRTRRLGRVGADPVGEAAARQLRADGVDTSRVQVDETAPTGLLIRDSHPGRAIDVRYYRTGSAASRLAPGQSGPEALSGARLFHPSGIAPMLSPTAAEAARRLVGRARAAGAVIAFDPNVRHRLGSAARWTQEPSAVSMADPVGAGDAFAAGHPSARLRDLLNRTLSPRRPVRRRRPVQAATDTDGLPTAAARAGGLRRLPGFRAPPTTRCRCGRRVAPQHARARPRKGRRPPCTAGRSPAPCWRNASSPSSGPTATTGRPSWRRPWSPPA